MNLETVEIYRLGLIEGYKRALAGLLWDFCDDESAQHI